MSEIAHRSIDITDYHKTQCYLDLTSEKVDSCEIEHYYDQPVTNSFYYRSTK